MADLTPDQQKEYDERLANYKPVGSFANCSINHFQKYVVDGELDEEAVIEGEKLNERQIPFLKIELLAAGYVKKPEDVDAAEIISDPLPEGFPSKAVLESGGVVSIKQLVALPDDALLSIPGIGPASLEKIREAQSEVPPAV